MLSLIGFQTIILSSDTIKPFDFLKIGRGVQIGGVDILAYKQVDCLLLVDCTIKVPDDKKFQELRDAKKHISSILASYQRIRVVPVIFTSVSCSHLKTDTEVRVVDEYQTEETLERIAKGKIEDIQNMF